MKKAVITLSGGMDSALCTAIAVKQGYSASALHLNYGQRTEKRELTAFNQICDFYEIKERLIVDIGYLSQIGASSLTDPKIEVSIADLSSTEIPASYVPFRNGNILAITASWAEVIGASAVFTGASEADSSGYPDCREEFFDAFQRAVNLGTKPKTNIQIKTPLIKMTKADIVSEGFSLGVPFELTWSCYNNSEKACGECDSCALRMRGFTEAGRKDPIEYAKK